MAIISEERLTRKDDEWVKYKLFNDETVDETTSSAVDIRNAKSIAVVIETSSTVSSGVVTFEGALSSDYSGTWKSITTLSLTAGSAVFMYTADASANSVLPGAYVRLRISTNVQNGTIDAYIIVQY